MGEVDVDVRADVHQEVQGGDVAAEPEVGRGIPGHACKRPMTSMIHPSEK
jgi:hypothetical protein